MLKTGWLQIFVLPSDAVLYYSMCILVLIKRGGVLSVLCLSYPMMVVSVNF